MQPKIDKNNLAFQIPAELLGLNDIKIDHVYLTCRMEMESKDYVVRY